MGAVLGEMDLILSIISGVLAMALSGCGGCIGCEDVACPAFKLDVGGCEPAGSEYHSSLLIECKSYEVCKEARDVRKENTNETSLMSCRTGFENWLEVEADAGACKGESADEVCPLINEDQESIKICLGKNSGEMIAHARMSPSEKGMQV